MWTAVGGGGAWGSLLAALGPCERDWGVGWACRWPDREYEEGFFGGGQGYVAGCGWVWRWTAEEGARLWWARQLCGCVASASRWPEGEGAPCWPAGHEFGGMEQRHHNESQRYWGSRRQSGTVGREELAESLWGSTARPGRDKNTGRLSVVGSLWICSICSSILWSFFQFINRVVDIPAAYRSWYAQCTLCSRPWTFTGTVLWMFVDAPVVVQRQVPWLGRAGNCGSLRSCSACGRCPVPGQGCCARRCNDCGSRNAWFDYGYMFCIIQGGFWKKFLRFSTWRGRLGSWGRFSVLAGTLSTQAVACSLLVLLVWRTSRFVPTIAGSLQIDASVARELHLEICTFFYEPPVFSAFSTSQNFPRVDFFGFLSTHSCECSRAGGAGVARSLLPGDSAPGMCHFILRGCCHKHLVWMFASTTTTTIIQSGEAPFLTGEEPPPHSGELKHALPQAGGPTQSHPAHMSSGHHISMEHRLRRKQLNSDTNASNKTYLKEIQEKRKEETFSSEKMKKEDEKH